MTITGTVRVVGIFGDPVAQSLSPLMQNAALPAAGIDAVYVPFHVTPSQLGDAILRAIRSLGLLGVNLAIPHKEAACGLVEELDSAALVNCSRNWPRNLRARLLLSRERKLSACGLKRLRRQGSCAPFLTLHAAKNEI